MKRLWLYRNAMGENSSAGMRVSETEPKKLDEKHWRYRGKYICSSYLVLFPRSIRPKCGQARLLEETRTGLKVIRTKTLKDEMK